MKEIVEKIVFEKVTALAKEQSIEALMKPDLNSILYGQEGNLDSMSLVRLIAEVESSISKEFKKNIVLADERAMSQRNSPFHSIGNLVNYIITLLEEKNG